MVAFFNTRSPVLHLFLPIHCQVITAGTKRRSQATLLLKSWMALWKKGRGHESNYNCATTFSSKCYRLEATIKISRIKSVHELTLSFIYTEELFVLLSKKKKNTIGNLWIFSIDIIMHFNHSNIIFGINFGIFSRQRSIGSSGRVGRGAKKHEIYVATFGGHLFYDLFVQSWGGIASLAPPGSATATSARRVSIKQLVDI